MSGADLPPATRRFRVYRYKRGDPGWRFDPFEVPVGLRTTVLDALPDTRYAYPPPEIWPFVAALGVTAWLVWSIWSAPGFVWGMIPPALAFIAWYWPNKQDAAEEVAWEKEP